MSKKNALFFVEDLSEHPPIACGLFALADTHGYPLADSIAQCRTHKFAPGLIAYVCDAVLSGWTVDRAVRVVRDALRDLGEQMPALVEYGLRLAAKSPDRWSTKSMKTRSEPKP